MHYSKAVHHVWKNSLRKRSVWYAPYLYRSILAKRDGSAHIDSVLPPPSQQQTAERRLGPYFRHIFLFYFLDYEQ